MKKRAAKKTVRLANGPGYRVEQLGDTYYPKVKPYWRELPSIEPDARITLLSDKLKSGEELVRYGRFLRWSLHRETLSAHILTETYFVRADDAGIAQALMTKLAMDRGKRMSTRRLDIHKLYRALEHLLYLAPVWECFELAYDFYKTLQVDALTAHAFEEVSIASRMTALAKQLERLRRGEEPTAKDYLFNVSPALKKVTFQGHPWGDQKRKPVRVELRGSEVDLMRQSIVENRIDEALTAFLRMKPTNKGYSGIPLWAPTEWYVRCGLMLMARGPARDRARVRKRLLAGSELDAEQRAALEAAR